MNYTDPYQWFRMLVIWPMLVIAPVSVLASLLVIGIRSSGRTRSQVTICVAVGMLAAIVGGAIATNWNGSDFAWKAFTLGLAFVGIVLWSTIYKVWIHAR